MGAAVEAGPALSAPPGGAAPDAPGAGSGAFALAGSGVRVATSAWTVRLMAGCVCLDTPSEGTSQLCVARTPQLAVRTLDHALQLGRVAVEHHLALLVVRVHHQDDVLWQAQGQSAVREGAAATGRRRTRTPLRGVAQLTIFWNGNSLQGMHSASGRAAVFEARPALGASPQLAASAECSWRVSEAQHVC